MITNDEREKINMGFKKDKRSSFAAIITFSILEIFFIYFMLRYVNEDLTMVSLLVPISLGVIGIYAFFTSLYPRDITELKDDGIEIISHGKSVSIKYDEIELVVMNEMGSGGLYVNIFFTKNGKKYFARSFQTEIKEPLKFIKTLREKGIEVRILEPSFRYQKSMISAGLRI